MNKTSHVQSESATPNGRTHRVEGRDMTRTELHLPDHHEWEAEPWD